MCCRTRSKSLCSSPLSTRCSTTNARCSTLVATICLPCLLLCSGTPPAGRRTLRTKLSPLLPQPTMNTVCSSSVLCFSLCLSVAPLGLDLVDVHGPGGDRDVLVFPTFLTFSFTFTAASSRVATARLLRNDSCGSLGSMGSPRSRWPNPPYWAP